MSSTKTTPADDTAVMLPRIESRILVVRDQKVIIDADLALLYGVPTKALNQAESWNMKSPGKRSALRLTAWFSALVGTP